MGGIAHKLLCARRVRFQWVHHGPSSLHTMQARLPIRPCPKLPKKLSRVSDGGGGGGASKASKEAATHFGAQRELVKREEGT